jgi:hypothetical protein
LAAKSFAVELRVDGTLKKGEFRVQPVWDETEGGHTMVSVRPEVKPQPTPSTAPSGAPSSVTQGDGISESGDSEMTVVRPRIITLYSVEVWKDGVRQAVLPITKNEITIGRGSRSTTVDLPLKGDVEVSRIHATLALDEEGRYWLTAKGRNPTLVSGREVPREERISVQPDEKIAICTYVLRIQP